MGERATRQPRHTRRSGARVSRIRRSSHRRRFMACPGHGHGITITCDQQNRLLSLSYHLVEKNSQSATDTPMVTGLELRRPDKSFSTPHELVEYLTVCENKIPWLILMFRRVQDPAHENIFLHHLLEGLHLPCCPSRVLCNNSHHRRLSPNGGPCPSLVFSIPNTSASSTMSHKPVHARQQHRIMRLLQRKHHRYPHQAIL